MYNNKTVSGILLIAGSSTRFKGTGNKNLERINEVPIFLYGLNVLDKNIYIDDIFLVVKESEKELIELELNSNHFSKQINIISGGASRQESVFNALKVSKSDLVVIQDGARPMIKDEYINNSLIELSNYTGTTIAVKSKDTIKIADDNNVVVETTKRQNTWIIQTPQCFDRKILLDTHIKQNGNPDITDDCMMLEKEGYRIKLVEGDYTNIKVTTKEDLNIAQEILSSNSSNV